MATLADAAYGRSRSPIFAEFIDRWIYVFMAGLFLVVVLAGFLPDSAMKLAAVQAGQRAPFPVILHVHAVLMGSWLLLLFAQTMLVATGYRGMHRQLGLAAFALAPALVLVGFFLIPAMDGQIAAGIRHGPPAVQAQLKPIFGIVLDIMLLQIRIGILFPLLIAWGIAVRRSDAGLHKRLMVLGTAAPLAAATDRMQWLPTTMPHSPLTADVWPLVVLLPMFAWDLYRLRRVHKAYVIYLGASLVLSITTHLLWGTALWHGIAKGLIGAGDL